jgi:hypothetical protein
LNTWTSQHELSGAFSRNPQIVMMISDRAGGECQAAGKAHIGIGSSVPLQRFLLNRRYRQIRPENRLISP